MSDDVLGLQRLHGGPRRVLSSASPAIGPRARVRWAREHLGAVQDGARVDSIWAAVWVPLADEVSDMLEAALMRGHAACPLDAENYIDLTAMWNAPPRAEGGGSGGAGGDSTSASATLEGA